MWDRFTVMILYNEVELELHHTPSWAKELKKPESFPLSSGIFYCVAINFHCWPRLGNDRPNCVHIIRPNCVHIIKPNRSLIETWCIWSNLSTAPEDDSDEEGMSTSPSTHSDSSSTTVELKWYTQKCADCKQIRVDVQGKEMKLTFY